MTEAELQAIEALAAAATPGPWIHSFDTIDDARGVSFCQEAIRGNYFEDCRFAKSADFIAASREAVPALCAEVRRLQEAVVKEREACAAKCFKRMPKGEWETPHTDPRLAYELGRIDQAQADAAAIRARGESGL